MGHVPLGAPTDLTEARQEHPGDDEEGYQSYCTVCCQKAMSCCCVATSSASASSQETYGDGLEKKKPTGFKKCSECGWTVSSKTCMTAVSCT
ncbi:hypothetical protein UY3_10757 [Chelonia mydas]|uniref:Uncharacterized protein n=1 Tax=Chelonia mydas TaxID=8469 RepID=M7BVC7_CHEMY|nr:hypothetical protein UY3_10757 [Chelonia mydas]